MENIARFTQAARAYGLSDAETFQTVDLYEKMNLHQVVLCLFALGRKVKIVAAPFSLSRGELFIFRLKSKVCVVSVRRRARRTNAPSPRRRSSKATPWSALNTVTTRELRNRALSSATLVTCNFDLLRTKERKRHTINQDEEGLPE